MELDHALNTIGSANASSENLNTRFETAVIKEPNLRRSDSTGSGWASSDGDYIDDVETVKKHDKFNKARKMHYNMKTVIAHARELVENEEGEEGYSDPNKHYDETDGDEEMGMAEGSSCDELSEVNHRDVEVQGVFRTEETKNKNCS
jgi:Protein phosphatase inhibitor 2 (IPP-2)